MLTLSWAEDGLNMGRAKLILHDLGFALVFTLQASFSTPLSVHNAFCKLPLLFPKARSTMFCMARSRAVPPWPAGPGDDRIMSPIPQFCLARGVELFSLARQASDL